MSKWRWTLVAVPHTHLRENQRMKMSTPWTPTEEHIETAAFRTDNRKKSSSLWSTTASLYMTSIWMFHSHPHHVIVSAANAHGITALTSRPKQPFVQISDIVNSERTDKPTRTFASARCGSPTQKRKKNNNAKTNLNPSFQPTPTQERNTGDRQKQTEIPPLEKKNVTTLRD